MDYNLAFLLRAREYGGPILRTGVRLPACFNSGLRVTSSSSSSSPSPQHANGVNEPRVIDLAEPKQTEEEEDVKNESVNKREDPMITHEEKTVEKEAPTVTTEQRAGEKGDSVAKEKERGWKRTTRSVQTNGELRGRERWMQTLKLVKPLTKHSGCVNSIQWNSTGDLLVTGSDDCQLCIWTASNEYKLAQTIETGHSRNIFCAKFVPMTSDSKLLSCGMDGEIRCTDVNRPSGQDVLLFSGARMVLKLAFLADNPFTFLSTHQDGTVRLFDIRSREQAGEVVVTVKSESGSRVATNCIALDPLGSPKFVLSCADPLIRLYDLRMTGENKGADAGAKPKSSLNASYQCVARFAPLEVVKRYCSQASEGHRGGAVTVTGVDYNVHGEVAATYSREDAIVISVNEGHPSHNAALSEADGIPASYRDVQTGIIQSYKGHMNERTFLKEIAFLGDNQYVTTGSDCGNAFIWDKNTAELVQLLDADGSVVNGVAPHPWLPHLATCGIDSEGKVWEPSSEITFDPERARSNIEANSKGRASDNEWGGTISMNELMNFVAMLQARQGRAFNIEELFAGLQDEGEEEEEDETVTAALNAIEAANATRGQGNNHFKVGHFEQAGQEYDSAVQQLEAIQSDHPAVLSQRRSSLILSLLNRAACNLKRQLYNEVIADSTRVLGMKRGNIKALFRRAKAYVALGQLGPARADINAARDLEPDNPELVRLLEEVEALNSNEMPLDSNQREAP